MSAMMIVLGGGWGLLGVAVAQQSSEFVPEGADCGDVRVIMGTAGQRNASEAIQVNANTYSASSFAGRFLARSDIQGLEVSDSRWSGAFVSEINSTYGATRVPVFHPANDSRPQECADENRVVSKPFDMHAANVGFVARRGSFGLMVATSFTWAAAAPGDQFFRVFMSSFVAPTYILMGAMTAPLLDLMVPGPLDFGGPTSGMGVDWLAGMTAELGPIDIGAAWLASQGGYVSAYESASGAYAFAALRPGQKPVYELGLDRLDAGNLGAGSRAASKLGLTSASYQNIPFLLDPEAAAQAEAADDQEKLDSLVYQLRVGAVRQQNLGGIVDLQARYRLAPDPALSELVLGLHTPGYHTPRGDSTYDYDQVGFIVQGGLVSTPTVWSQGTGPARLLSTRVGVRTPETGSGYMGSFTLLRNDPEQLQLYPFARDAISYNLAFSGVF